MDADAAATPAPFTPPESLVPLIFSAGLRICRAASSFWLLGAMMRYGRGHLLFFAYATRYARHTLPRDADAAATALQRRFTLCCALKID